MRKPTSLDLFAGCGGLTRGLEWAGFDCIAFNELNKDAADTFSTNFPEAIRLEGDIKSAVSDEVIENILLPLINEKGGLDLLSGGPPCQGFSGIGHRRTHKLEKHEIPTNHLFHEMIRVIEKLQPNVFLFENVVGILSGRWTEDGMPGEIFRDVWEGFSHIEGYDVQPTILHAYGFGVPQNRPRVMIMGVKKFLVGETDVIEFDVDHVSGGYAARLRNNGGLFPTWDESEKIAPDPIDLLSDLDFEGWSESNQRYGKKAETAIQKFLRDGVEISEEGHEILTDHQFSKHTPRVVQRFQYLIDHRDTVWSKLPERVRTKKFSQKALPERWENQPTMTVTSLPDDYVHYRKPRSFSVREWARLQTFPDKHVFCGKRTTGGARRAGNPAEGMWEREVPKYTQIGNAVPPLLAKAIGEHIQNMLRSQEPNNCE